MHSEEKILSDFRERIESVVRGPHAPVFVRMAAGGTTDYGVRHHVASKVFTLAQLRDTANRLEWFGVSSMTKAMLLPSLLESAYQFCNDGSLPQTEVVK